MRIPVNKYFIAILRTLVCHSGSAKVAGVGFLGVFRSNVFEILCFCLAGKHVFFFSRRIELEHVDRWIRPAFQLKEAMESRLALYLDLVHHKADSSERRASLERNERRR